jgi:hypothetical protein
MKLRLTTIGFLIAVPTVWATHAALTNALGTPPQAPQLIPSKNAVDAGCRDSRTNPLAKTEPSWVSVIPRDHRKKVLEGRVVESHVATEDFPFNHDSHDMCFFVVPDASYENMMAEGNMIKNGRRTVEVEWETKHYPISSWPVPGDQAWVIGRHVFDCGHPEPPGYRTEIHPPVGTAFTRREPHIFSGDTHPSYTNKTYIYLGNQGGYYVDRVGGRDYVFNVPLPPRPALGRTATPRFQVIKAPGGGLPPPRIVPKQVGGQTMLEVTIPLANVADPTTRWDLYEWIPRGRNGAKFDRPANVFAYEAVIVGGWSDSAVALASRRAYREMSVTFDTVRVHDSHDIRTGEWNMFMRANGSWIKVPEASVRDGSTIRVNRTVRFLVPEDDELTIYADGWEDDNDGHFRVGMPPGVSAILALDENKALGKVTEKFDAKQNFGVGTRSVKSSTGDYTLNYTIREVRRFAPGGVHAPPDRPTSPIRTTGGGA